MGPWYVKWDLCKQLQKCLSQAKEASSWKPAGNAHGKFPYAVEILKKYLSDLYYVND